MLAMSNSTASALWRGVQRNARVAVVMEEGFMRLS
jgi:hypothetical protein